MSIHNPEKFVSTLWDWKCLDGCFGNTRIRPTDVDGFVERNGHFLWIETKSAGVCIPVGQQRTFDALVKLSRFTVLIIWGEPQSPVELLLIRPKGHSHYPGASITKLRHIVRFWFAYADAHPDVDAAQSMDAHIDAALSGNWNSVETRPKYDSSADEIIHGPADDEWAIDDDENEGE